MKTRSLMIISLMFISASLIAIGCDGGGGNSLYCACNYNPDTNNDGAADAEFCIEGTCSGSGCEPCNCASGDMPGDKVSSCNGVAAGSTTVTNDDFTGEITCYAIDDGGTAFCALILSGDFGP